MMDGLRDGPAVIPFPAMTAGDILDRASQTWEIDPRTVADAAAQGRGLLVCVMPGGELRVVLGRDLAPAAAGLARRS